MAKVPRILYFIDGPAPNAMNKAEANELRGQGAIVSFRNARFVDESSLEPADGIAGPAIPDAYKATNFKSAEDAIGAFHDAQDKEAEDARRKGGDDNTDNLGSHTLPNLAQIPVAARVRRDDSQTQTGTVMPAQPTSPNFTTVGTENAGAPADAAGRPVPPVPQTPAENASTVTPAPGAQPPAPTANPFGAPAFDPTNPPPATK